MRCLQFTFFIISILSGFPAFPQRIVNVYYSTLKSAEGDKYIINYSLESPFGNIPCQIRVKLATGENKDAQVFYLKELKGDAGDLVYPGNNKQIIWDYAEELIQFSADNVKLDIEVVPSVQVNEKIKKGRQLTVTLAQIYIPNKTYAVKLFQQGKEISRLSDVMLIENTFQVQIPKHSKVKNNYQLSLSDGETVFFSNAFKVKRKVSLGWAIVPLVGIPAYILINQNMEDNKSLPGPPGSGYPGGN